MQIESGRLFQHNMTQEEQLVEVLRLVNDVLLPDDETLQKKRCWVSASVSPKGRFGLVEMKGPRHPGGERPPAGKLPVGALPRALMTNGNWSLGRISTGMATQPY
jgi:hypothetical protein